MLLYYLLESPLCVWPKQNLIHSEEKNQLIKMCPGVIISSDINMVIRTLFHMFKKLSKEIEDINKQTQIEFQEIKITMFNRTKKY